MIANKMGTLYEETIKDTLSLLQHDSLQKLSLHYPKLKIFIFTLLEPHLILQNRLKKNDENRKKCLYHQQFKLSKI